MSSDRASVLDKVVKFRISRFDRSWDDEFGNTSRFMNGIAFELKLMAR